MTNFTLIACSVFRMELEALVERKRLNLPIRYLDSLLHLQPERLLACVQALVEDERNQGRPVVLLMGECHPRLCGETVLSGVRHVCGHNCIEILLGKEEYRRLRREGVFFLLPEWTLRWREIFEEHLKLPAEVAPHFMRDMHTRLLYLDFGVMPVPDSHLQAVSRYTNLPYQVMPCSLERLVDAVLAAGSGKDDGAWA